MKYCVNCGAELENDATVCQNCGQEIALPTPEVPKKDDSATAPVTISTVMGLITILNPYGIPALIMSIIGIVFGSREKKATGKSLGLVLNIISLVITSLGLLGIIAYFVFYFALIFMVFGSAGAF